MEDLAKKALNILLWEQHKSGTCTDVQIVASNGVVHAHKAILAFTYKPLNDVLKHQADEELVIILATDFSTEEIENTLEYLYFPACSDEEIPTNSFVRCFGHEPVLNKVILPCSASLQEDDLELFKEEICLPEVDSPVYEDALIGDSDDPVVTISAIKGKKRPAPQENKPPSRSQRAKRARRVKKVDDIKSEITTSEEEDDKDEEDLVCDCCGETWQTKTKLSKHKQYQRRKIEAMKKKEDKDKAMDTTCKHCKKVFEDKTLREEHEGTCMRQLFGNIVLKDDVDPYDVQGDAFECLYCEEVLKSVRMLKNHVRLKHMVLNADKVMTCLICEKVIRRNRSSRHVIIHINSKYYRYQCKECDFRAYEPTKLDEHVRAVHTFERSLKCKYCNMGFIRSSARAEHHRSCEMNPNRKEGKGLMQFECPFCARRYDLSKQLQIHKNQCAANPNRRVKKEPFIPVETATPTTYQPYALPIEKTIEYQNAVGGTVNNQILEILGQRLQ